MVTDYSLVIRHRRPVKRLRVDLPTRIAVAVALFATALAALVPLAIT